MTTTEQLKAKPDEELAAMMRQMADQLDESEETELAAATVAAGFLVTLATRLRTDRSTYSVAMKDGSEWSVVVQECSTPGASP